MEDARVQVAQHVPQQVRSHSSSSPAREGTAGECVLSRKRGSSDTWLQLRAIVRNAARGGGIGYQLVLWLPQASTSPAPARPPFGPASSAWGSKTLSFQATLASASPHPQRARHPARHMKRQPVPSIRQRDVLVRHVSATPTQFQLRVDAPRPVARWLVATRAGGRQTCCPAHAFAHSPCHAGLHKHGELGARRPSESSEGWRSGVACDGPRLTGRASGALRRCLGSGATWPCMAAQISGI